ncbi:MAG: bifunctional glutamate N-acetyltransferase/amino-acid acetyltransferase ArgJ [Sphaerochaetaceae bacterium]|jgi:glutamate N-acetyltransferase/amino-acid N-acetyltransferase|nr:bifunctional glutamate N-acetyltransferase/amino-acid acetyltransferase ArgJ [Sphaerochaetaceae bacterium]MDD3671508.1 bifunctional glutamate N-acetyltransferase/amino-acid acetyltransferase ArgJ [Sphaerochaetaceae bacterium]MDD4259167.1 bifunctional glutamate N-acetyltransferase/amino-acid acetyltransferase ArgJ [Sphaerochaetaceae bacterium]MDD4842502.1 bifunctional glutamate N-acetyltransferase/amino-acid acetyltransferase ArgJ [Sphaerochaetaceae bacterium]MDX9933781.1 bifunctional glutama
MKWIDGGITAPKGYKAAGFAAGIKKKKKDIALVISDSQAVVAGAFTTNMVKAAPVLWDQQIVASNEPVKAIVINSGNANACTGEQGMLDAAKMAETTAKALNCQDTEVLVCSTGVIGVLLPMDKIVSGIDNCASLLDTTNEAAYDAAWAICTTDTFVKQVAVELDIGGHTVKIGGMAKGSGMIHPNMATMLSFITTDAEIDKGLLQDLLGDSIAESYNMISVDGDTSTNDTVIVLANGCSGAPRITSGSDYEKLFADAFGAVHAELAKLIVKDGEGAGKFIQVEIEGAASVEDARLMARSVISSNLVKAAFFGADANWGRILCAMGYAKAQLDPSSVSMDYSSPVGTIAVLKHGLPLVFDEDVAKKILNEKEIVVHAVVGTGIGKATAWGCDLTYEYVRINGDYRS